VISALLVAVSEEQMRSNLRQDLPLMILGSIIAAIGMAAVVVHLARWQSGVTADVRGIAPDRPHEDSVKSTRDSGRTIQNNRGVGWRKSAGRRKLRGGMEASVDPRPGIQTWVHGYWFRFLTTFQPPEDPPSSVPAEVLTSTAPKVSFTSR
jgi:hypothetical protein